MIGPELTKPLIQMIERTTVGGDVTIVGSRPTRGVPISDLFAKRRGADTIPIGDWATLAPQPAARLPAEPKSDIVDVSVFGPELLRAGSQCLVQVYLHLLDQEAAVLALAKEVDPNATRRRVKTLATEIARGTAVEVIFEGRGLSVDQGKQDLVWRGNPEACDFTVTAPIDSAGQRFYPRIPAPVSSAPIGSVTFALRGDRRRTGRGERDPGRASTTL